MRALLATLCVALAVVFAGAGATSVVDRVQHAAHVEHEHGLRLAVADDHHDHHGAPPDQQDGDQDLGDRHPGPAHHHADAPTGVPAGVATSAHHATFEQAVLRPIEAAGAEGVRPGGLDRPPKPVANLV